ncbi:MAG: exosortase/archaeosortase family protein [Chitinivibrionales bacterium]
MQSDSPSVPVEHEKPMLLDAAFGMVSAFLFLTLIPIAAPLFSLIGSDNTYTHIPLIPLVSLFFFWKERKEIHRFMSPTMAQRIIAGAAGVGFLGFYLMMQLEIVGGGGDHISGSVALLWCAWISGFVAVYGMRAVPKAAFILFFMILSIPIPQAVLTFVVEMLRHGSAAMVQLFMSVTGTTFIRQGTLFHLGALSIDIAPECSGIRSSIALLMMSLIAGHMFLKTWWRKGILLIAAAVLMMVKNGIRITTLSLLAQHVDERFLTNSRLHSNGGILFFGIVFILLMVVLFALREKEAKPIKSSAPAR